MNEDIAMLSGLSLRKARPLQAVSSDSLVPFLRLSHHAPAAPADGDRYLTMAGVATLMHRSYCWVSRHWRKKLGLHPTSFGPPYLFDRREVEKYLETNRVVLRGRPKKLKA